MTRTGSTNTNHQPLDIPSKPQTLKKFLIFISKSKISGSKHDALDLRVKPKPNHHENRIKESIPYFG